jgi:hypothetical protein
MGSSRQQKKGRSFLIAKGVYPPGEKEKGRKHKTVRVVAERAQLTIGYYELQSSLRWISNSSLVSSDTKTLLGEKMRMRSFTTLPKYRKSVLYYCGIEDQIGLSV